MDRSPGPVVLRDEVGVGPQHGLQGGGVAEAHRRVELEGLVPRLRRVAAAAGHVTGHRVGGVEWRRRRRRRRKRMDVVCGEREIEGERGRAF